MCDINNIISIKKKALQHYKEAGSLKHRESFQGLFHIIRRVLFLGLMRALRISTTGPALTGYPPRFAALTTSWLSHHPSSLHRIRSKRATGRIVMAYIVSIRLVVLSVSCSTRRCSRETSFGILV